MRKDRIKIGVAILSGVWVAGSLIIGLRDFFPDWPWELNYLVGFIVFAFIMSWIIVDKDNQINNMTSGRPQLAVSRTAVGKEVDKTTSEVKIGLSFSFKNIGKKDAYKFRCNIGYAPEGEVSKFKFVDEVTSVNPILANNDHETVTYMSGSVKYTERDGVTEVPTRKALIVCIVSYRDSEYDGKLYEDDWWYSYRADRRYLGLMSEEEKNSMEPHVRKRMQNV